MNSRGHAESLENYTAGGEVQRGGNDRMKRKSPP